MNRNMKEMEREGERLTDANKDANGAEEVAKKLDALGEALTGRQGIEHGRDAAKRLRKHIKEFLDKKAAAEEAKRKEEEQRKKEKAEAEAKLKRQKEEAAADAAEAKAREEEMKRQMEKAAAKAKKAAAEAKKKDEEAKAELKRKEDELAELKRQTKAQKKLRSANDDFVRNKTKSNWNDLKSAITVAEDFRGFNWEELDQAKKSIKMPDEARKQLKRANDDFVRDKTKSNWNNINTALTHLKEYSGFNWEPEKSQAENSIKKPDEAREKLESEHGLFNGNPTDTNWNNLRGALTHAKEYDGFNWSELSSANSTVNNRRPASWCNTTKDSRHAYCRGHVRKCSHCGNWHCGWHSTRNSMIGTIFSFGISALDEEASGHGCG